LPFIYYCDEKARAASAQSVTMWQQATIEIMRRNHSTIACSCHIYMGVILRAHLVRGESHNLRNANGEDCNNRILGPIYFFHKLQSFLKLQCGSL